MVSCRVCKTSFEAGSYRDELCPGCGALVPVSVRLCPCCTLPFERRDVEGIIFDECAQCGGVFLDHQTWTHVFGDRARADAVVAALSRGINDLVSTSGRPALPCPACADAMYRKMSEDGAGIVLDICAAHGTFFDAGELPAIVGFWRRADERTATERHRDTPATRYDDSRWTLTAPPAVLGPLLYIVLGFFFVLAKSAHC